MRMGWDQQNLNAPRLAKIAEDIGIKMITVHGRTRCQFYDGEADWHFIQKVKDSVKIPVIVNGDITNFDKVNQALDASKADGIMIGRGCYGKPWFINQVINYLQAGKIIPEPNIEQKLATIIQHFEETLIHYGQEAGLRIFRKHIGWYSKGLPNSAEFRLAMSQEENPKRMISFITSLYQQSN